MHLTFLVCSVSIGIYQGCVRSKQTSTKEFFIADGKMGILPTAMSLLASLTSAASLLGTPVDIYYYGTMFIYYILSLFIATYLTIKFFIPKFHYIGSVSIYAYLEQRFSLTIRILVTCTYILVTILYMSIILYGPSLALSQVTGLNIWLVIGSCGLVCTIYTSIGGMKAVIWTDVLQALLMFIGLIMSIIIGIFLFRNNISQFFKLNKTGVIDFGGPSKVFETVKNGNRFQFSVIDLDPSIRYTIWSILIGMTFSSLANYACIQTQAQRYMCVKDTKAAQKVAWINYVMHASMQMLYVCVGCLIYAKYSQCDPLRAKLISRSDQLYPLFIMETLGRFPGFTGLFISSILSATLSTFSSGVNSIATVILEDVYKRISNKHSISNKHQIFYQIFGAYAAPILGVYLLGLFSSRVKSRSVLVAFVICFIFQTVMLVGSFVTVKSVKKQGGQLPTSVAGCVPSVNITLSLTTNQT
ncbi:unnamed protein product [Adineta steineri]|uniref:Uncharacterized protein n=1 Tax=Adineta steineri TaxID=433720 RepID=A0A813ZR40_9BILA|nr:unnamed protein product [Adineta steineri]CAF0902105.1 unnamed protein product [Adineta steineri]CAF0928669.1 unnamed protein product [Adineta steineri]